MNELELLQKRLTRETRARQLAERMAETRIRDYYLLNETLSKVQEELINTNKELEKAAKIKRDFLRVMSHELRTPLNGIIGMGQLLAYEIEGNDEASNFLKTLFDSSYDLLEMLNSILFFSELNSGKIKTNRDSVDIKKFNFDITSILEENRNKQVPCTILVDDDIPKTLIFDQRLIKRVLESLIDNAFKFTQEGSVNVKIKLIHSTDVPTIQFEVLDTGVGVKSNNLEHLMQEFTQEDSSLTREFGGIGLGLSLSQKILRALGSTLEVEKNEPQGSIFFFQLKCTNGSLS